MFPRTRKYSRFFFAAMARKGGSPLSRAPLTQRTHQVRRCTPRNKTGWYPRRSRVCPLVSSLPYLPLALYPSRTYTYSRRHGFLSPSHEVTYRDARCFTTWVKLSHQVVTRTPRSLPFALSRPPRALVLIKLFLLLRLTRSAARCIYNLGEPLRALSEPQNRYREF